MPSFHQLMTSATALLVLVVADAAADQRKSLDEAVSEARERYNGRVLSADTQRRDGRESHRIRILTNDGHVKRLQIDAGSGSPRRGQR